ncbi:hypothetical protein GCM10010275_24450 [Streptomyces litmocidini]|uniref:SsgA family sporulation/cell division regulator n=1 Tax=Streptomyces litmocidini TaxID=67318 RepID=UPI0019AD1720|nr:SsgA family sporulation/cell division regulator [Streptomyces litmocidini]GGU87549.1 hypothetical protein GCM10010275_24450 [Streptomyces litmocidini]
MRARDGPAAVARARRPGRDPPDVPAGGPLRRTDRLHADAAAPAVWTFAREPLPEGLFRPVGEGDVRGRPTATDVARELNVLLRSPDGDAFLRSRAAEVSVFVGRALDAVPPGSETDDAGMTRGLAALLGPEPAPEARRPPRG